MSLCLGSKSSLSADPKTSQRSILKRSQALKIASILFVITETMAYPSCQFALSCSTNLPILGGLSCRFNVRGRLPAEAHDVCWGGSG